MSTITRNSRGTPWTYRQLIWSFAQRDLKSRFRGTFLGWIWSLVLPLATLLIYAAVFSVIIRVEPPPLGDGSPGIYAVWLLVGMVAYNFFATGVNMMIPSLLGSGTLLQKIYLPSYVPVIGTAIAISTQVLIEFAILLVVLIVIGNVGITWVLFPLLFVMFFVFVVALAMTLSILNVYARDLQQIVGVIVQLLFFLSPVIYPVEQIPEEWKGIPVRAIMAANPIAEFITAFRDVLYGLTWPDLGQIAAMAGWTAAAVLLAWWVYLRKGQDIGEAI